MTVPLRLAISAAIVLVWMQFDMPVRAAGPSGVLYARAKVEEVLSPVEIKAKLLENKRVVKVRLQGLRSTTAKGKDRSSALRSRGDLRQGVYESASNYLKSAVEGKVVELWTKKGGRWDEKNRLVACVLVRNFFGEALEVNDELIKQGLCLVTREYLHTTFAKYKLLEQEAKRNRKGIWRGPGSGEFSKAHDH